MESDTALGDENLVERVARAICAEKCAFMGEPPCHTVMDGTEFSWPPETCCEPGCIAEARAALAVARFVIKEECARVAEVKLMNYDTVDEIPAAIRAME